MITSVRNARVKWVHALQDRRDVRYEERLFVVEGLRLAREAVAARIPARLVFHTDQLDERGRGLVNSLSRLGAEVQAVLPSVMAHCSGTETPPGLLAVLQMPRLAPPMSLSLALVLDQLADPGNLGTMLRTALAAGVEAVYLSQGTVDPYNPKVVRAAMGAHFRLPLETVEIGELPHKLSGLQLWLAEAGEGVPYYEVDWRPPVALLIGGEAHGPQRSLRSLTDRRVQIPMPGKFESLNAAVAAGVMLFEIARQRGAR